jgi:ATP-binding cassette, subfamily B, bacterial
MSFVLAIGFFVISNIFVLAQPYIFGQVLNTLQIGGPDLWHNFVFFLILYSIMPFFSWIFHGFGRIIERTTALYIGKNFKEHVFSVITELPFAWHSDNHS